MSKRNKRLIIMTILFLVLTLLLISSVFAGITDSRSGSSPPSSTSSSGNMVMLYEGQLVKKSLVETYLNINDQCEGTNQNCWGIVNDRVVVYGDTKGMKVQGGLLNPNIPDYWVGNYEVTESGLYDPSQKFYTSQNSLVTLDVEYGDLDFGGQTYNIPRGAHPTSLSTIGNSDSSVPVVTVVDNGQTWVYIGNVKMSQADYKNYEQRMKHQPVTVLGEKITYGEGDDEVSLNIDYQEYYHTLTETIGDTTNTRTTLSDGTVITQTSHELNAEVSTTTVDIPGMEPIDGILSGGHTKLGQDHVNGFPLYDSKGNELLNLITSGTRTTATVYGEGTEANPQFIYSSNSGLNPNSRLQTYNVQGERRIISDEGSYGNTNFETRYDHKENTAERVYTDNKGNVLAVMQQDSIDSDNGLSAGYQSGEIHTIIQEEYTNEKGKKRTREVFGTVSLDEVADGEVTATEVNKIDPKGDECSKECKEQYQAVKKSLRQHENRRLMPERAQALGAGREIGKFRGLSNLLYSGIGIQNGIREIDSFFSNNVLQKEYVASAICYNEVARFRDIKTEGVAVMEDASGNIQTVANIFAEMQSADQLICTRDANDEFICPEDYYCHEDSFCLSEETDEPVEGYFYKLSWGVQAPRDQAMTPFVDENNFAVEYNIQIGDKLIYVDEHNSQAPLKLINGDSDGQVLTWWTTEDFSGQEVCVRWGENSEIRTTGGSISDGGFKPFSKGSVAIGDVCNTVVNSELKTVEFNKKLRSRASSQPTSENSVTSDSLQVNLP